MNPAEAVYEFDGETAAPSAYAAGPWDSGLQHGGAPSALIAAIVDAMPSPVPMQVVRLNLDLIRPIPIAPMIVRTQVVREGRAIQLVEARIEIGGKETIRGAVLRMRSEPSRFETSAAPTGAAPPDECPPPDGSIIAMDRPSFGAIMDFRVARGTMWAGRSAVWFRMKHPLIAGQALSPLMRAVAAADFGNGSSAALDFQNYTFINADLSVHLARQPAGEWILLDAETQLGPAGRGLATSRLADEHGYFGRAAQSLVIAPR
jgi:hypothetical protein